MQLFDQHRRRALPASAFAEFLESETAQPIPQRFERQASIYAARLAVRTRDQAFSYGELNRLANRIAHAVLAELGPARNRVAILVEQGPGAIAAILGALKAGKIYVPLDPSFPLTRNTAILADAEPDAVISSSRNLQLASSLTAGRFPVIDIGELTSTLSETNPNIAIAPDQTAYIMYTSGSSGQPKGVVQSHRNVLNVVLRYTNGACLTADDRFTLLPSTSVTASVGNIFGALLNGAALFPFDVRQEDVDDLGEWLTCHQLTIYHSVPTVFRHFAATLSGENLFPKLRLIRLGSAPVLKSDFELYRRHFSGDCVFVNGYGASEMSTASQYVADQYSAITGPLVPIGWPLGDTRIALLDDDRKPAPIGAAGEIALYSPHLALGYWRSPELTAEAFVTTDDGGRFYLTGDVGRMSADGCIEHLGRKDFQVKIRGYRVETAEIELVLTQHPKVREAAVVGRGEANDEKRLIAYIVADAHSGEDQSETSVELRSHLKSALPDHMLPSAFVIIDRLPLTPNGKLDLKALPAPDNKRSRSKTAFVAPRTHDEEKLAAIFAAVLKLVRIGIHDNFFELGGHSLLATQVVSRISNELQTRLPLRVLFEAPTVAALGLEIMRSETGTARHSQIHSPISRRSTSGNTPLSFAQFRLWFLDRYEPDSPFYDIPATFRIKGALNVSALRASFTEIVRRHEALRTNFPAVDNEPVQLIRAAWEFDLPVIDLVTSAPVRRETEAQRLAHEEANRPFDLVNSPLFRASLLKLADDSHVLLINVHHIVFDGSSKAVLYRELSALYSAFAAGRNSPLPELTIQYADYAAWQRSWLTGVVLDRQLTYWKKQLGGAASLLTLPSDHPRPKQQTFNGAQQPRLLGPSLLDKLKVVSKANRATLFMTLLAAFKVLLARYTRSDDIVVGSPIAGRTRSETENLIGFLGNTLVLRTDCSGDPTFLQLLSRVRETCLEGYAHQDLPFEKLVEELNPERSLSHSPLFQVMFALQNTDDTPLQLAGLAVEQIRVARSTAQFDLLLSLTETDPGLQIIAQYNTGLFNAETITRLLGHYQTLLEGIVANPEQRLSALPLLTEDECDQLLIDWNQTKTDYPKDQPIASLFEAQVQKTPDAIALIFEDQSLSYADLNQRANQVAHHLISLGVGPEVRVAVLLERSIEMVIALLGILKAGGAYLPLDPAYPKERLSFVLEDSQAKLLLTQSTLKEELPAHPSLCVFIDPDEAFDHSPATDPKTTVTPDNLAYVIYTSGSTGRPKGVCIPHSALANFLYAIREQTKMVEDDALLAVTTLSFDIAALEMYLPLITGARLVVSSREGAADGAQLIRKLTASPITFMQATPATWRLLIESGWQGDGRLKLLCGGEVLSRELADQLLTKGRSLTNLYGPTETTVWSILSEVKRTDRITLGRPIANTEVYILDSHLNPTPIGVSGELHIGGAGLARGYLNRPELTQEKFIPDPFSEDKTSRLYKTGDLACYLADGNIEYLGRLDHQVKIRGFRIELGEIEAILSQHSQVKEAVVIAREDTPGDKRLVAYVVSAQIPASPSDKLGTDSFSKAAGTASLAEDVALTQSLRDFLKPKLPDYMLPSAFVILDKLPVTPNGKVDRKALPAPEYQAKASYVAPRTPHEEKLAAIWAEVLKLDQVGIDDNFFELGGHSLLAMRVVSRVRQALSIELPLRELFAAPTISGLAAQIEAVGARSRPALNREKFEL